MKNQAYYQRLGQIFFEQRDKFEYSLADVAERIGIPKRTYYDYEKGTRTMPLDIMEKLCSLFDMDIDEVFATARKHL